MILFKTLWLDDYVESKTTSTVEYFNLKAGAPASCLCWYFEYHELKEPEDELSVLNPSNEKSFIQSVMQLFYVRNLTSFNVDYQSPSFFKS